ncbi:MAG: hypothetical protein AAF533_01710 [Acidobacteriota bacterium]
MPRHLLHLPRRLDVVEATLDELRSSQHYSHVALGPLHFSPGSGTTAELCWSGVPLRDVPESIWSAVDRLSTGEHPKVVIGRLGRGSRRSWKWMAQDVESAARRLFDLAVGPQPLTGIDLEPAPDVPTDVLTELTTRLANHAERSPFLLSQVLSSDQLESLRALPATWSRLVERLDWLALEHVSGNCPVTAHAELVSGRLTGHPLAAERVMLSHVIGWGWGPPELERLASSLTRLTERHGGRWGGLATSAHPELPLPHEDWVSAIDQALHGGSVVSSD